MKWIVFIVKLDTVIVVRLADEKNKSGNALFVCFLSLNMFQISVFFFYCTKIIVTLGVTVTLFDVICII